MRKPPKPLTKGEVEKISDDVFIQLRKLSKKGIETWDVLCAGDRVCSFTDSAVTQKDARSRARECAIGVVE